MSSSTAIHRPGRLMTAAELGMLVGMASIGMLFGTLMLSYGLARLRSPVWPPIGVTPIGAYFPSMGTAVLLASSYFVHEAQKSFMAQDFSRFRAFWRNASLLGVLFLGLQVAFWIQLQRSGFYASGNLYGGIVYVLTGVHAVHVLGGMAVLAYVFFKFKQPRLPKDLPVDFKSQAPKLAAWYWHFMDVLWIMLFILLVWM